MMAIIYPTVAFALASIKSEDLGIRAVPAGSEL